jgi:hypothetical protein
LDKSTISKNAGYLRFRHGFKNNDLIITAD